MSYLSFQLEIIQTITPSNAGIVTDYLMPNFLHFASDPEVYVRCTYALCLGSLAETSSRFLALAKEMIAAGTLQTAKLNDFEGIQYEVRLIALIIGCGKVQ